MAGAARRELPLKTLAAKETLGGYVQRNEEASFANSPLSLLKQGWSSMKDDFNWPFAVIV